MRTRRSIAVLTAVVAMSAAAILMPPAATGTDNIQIVNEATGVPCGQVGLPSACDIHVVGEATLLSHGPFGTTVIGGPCDFELTAQMGQSGTVRIDTFTPDPAAPCSSIFGACSLPWQGSMEETASQVTRGTVTACVDFTIPGWCSTGALSFTLVETAGEVLSFAALDGPGTGPCELQLEAGELESGSDPIHINHL